MISAAAAVNPAAEQQFPEWRVLGLASPLLADVPAMASALRADDGRPQPRHGLAQEPAATADIEHPQPFASAAGFEAVDTLSP